MKGKLYSDSELKLRNEGLKEIKKFMDGLGVEFMLFDGVLLGAIREKNFIKWDWDVELAIRVEDIYDHVDTLLEETKNSGFSIINIDLNYNNFKLNVFKYDTKYSILGFHQCGSLRKRKLYQYPEIFFENTEKIEFLGEKYNVPSPPQKYLTYQYGDDWEIPKQSFNANEYIEAEVFTSKGNFKLLNKAKNALVKIFKKSISMLPKKNNVRIKMISKVLCENMVIVKFGLNDINTIKSAVGASRYTGLSIISITDSDLERMKNDGKFSLSNNITSLDKDTPVLVVMDLDGQEVELIGSLMSEFSNHTNIRLLVKANPNMYSRHNSMRRILRELFEIDFVVKFIESAGKKYPKMFEERKLTPIFLEKTTALYENIDEDTAIHFITRNIQEKVNYPPGIITQVVGSFLLVRGV